MKILSDEIGEVKNKIKLGINGYMIFIYGHNAKVHDSAVGKKGSFKRVIEKIKGLTRNNQYVIANVIVTEKNYKYLKNVIRLLTNLDVFHIQLTLSKNTKLDFRKIKQHIFETLDMKLKPEYEKLEIYFSDSKEPFFLPTVKESLEKMIEFNNWKLFVLSNKKEMILKKSKISEKSNSIEGAMKANENELDKLKKEEGKLSKSMVLRNWRMLDKGMENLEKKREKKWKKIEPYENRKKDIESKKIELLKKNRILDEWKEIDKSKKKLQKEFNKKWKRIRVPKITELGQMLEKEYLVTKGELTEPLHLLKSGIRRIDEELMSMWNKEFLSIDREIVRLAGKESLLLKSKGLENIWKKLNEDKEKVMSKIEKYRSEYLDVIENKIYEFKKGKIRLSKGGAVKKWKKIKKVIENKIKENEIEKKLLLKKHGILRIEKEMKYIENKNQLLKTKLKKLELNKQINPR